MTVKTSPVIPFECFSLKSPCTKNLATKWQRNRVKQTSFLEVFSLSKETSKQNRLIKARLHLFVINQKANYWLRKKPLFQEVYQNLQIQSVHKTAIFSTSSISAANAAVLRQVSRDLFWNVSFDKGRIKSVVLWFLRNYGQDKTIELLENFKYLGYKYATRAGVSLGVDDLKIPPSKSFLLLDGETLVETVSIDYKRAEITGIEKYQSLIDTWHRISETLKNDVVKNFERTDVLNPVYMMAFSGARGNMSQVRQLVGMRGLMADPQGQIIEFPIRSNFREGLTLTEYIISSYGARKGIVDTALRTANAGYLTRRLVDVAQHVIISHFDCGTSRGVFVTDMKDGKKTIYSLQNRLLGRVLAQDVYSHGLLIAERNTEVSFDLAAKIAKHQKKVFIRSPLTCETRKLVCQLCYGWSLAQGRLVAIGEAVGVIAAQSIGEPGTQLTMRTFHTGGAFSADLADQIISPSKAVVQYAYATTGILIRTPQGKIAFLTKNNTTFSLINHETGLNRIYKVPAYTILFARHNEKIVERQVVAQIASPETLKKQRDEAEQTIMSEIEGQFYCQRIDVFEKMSEYGEMSFEAWGWGYVWILSGKMYELPVTSNFFPKFTDFVNQKSILSQIGWMSSEKCLLNRNFVSTNETSLSVFQQNPANISLSKFEYNPTQQKASMPSLKIKLSDRQINFRDGLRENRTELKEDINCILGFDKHALVKTNLNKYSSIFIEDVSTRKKANISPITNSEQTSLNTIKKPNFNYFLREWKQKLEHCQNSKKVLQEQKTQPQVTHLLGSKTVALQSQKKITHQYSRDTFYKPSILRVLFQNTKQLYSKKTSISKLKTILYKFQNRRNIKNQGIILNKSVAFFNIRNLRYKKVGYLFELNQNSLARQQRFDSKASKQSYQTPSGKMFCLWPLKPRSHFNIQSAYKSKPISTDVRQLAPDTRIISLKENVGKTIQSYSNLSSVVTPTDKKTSTRRSSVFWKPIENSCLKWFPKNYETTTSGILVSEGKTIKVPSYSMLTRSSTNETLIPESGVLNPTTKAAVLTQGKKATSDIQKSLDLALRKHRSVINVSAALSGYLVNQLNNKQKAFSTIMLQHFFNKLKSRKTKASKSGKKQSTLLANFLVYKNIKKIQFLSKTAKFSSFSPGKNSSDRKIPKISTIFSKQLIKKLLFKRKFNRLSKKSYSQFNQKLVAVRSINQTKLTSIIAKSQTVYGNSIVELTTDRHEVALSKQPENISFTFYKLKNASFLLTGYSSKPYLRTNFERNFFDTKKRGRIKELLYKYNKSSSIIRNNLLSCLKYSGYSRKTFNFNIVVKTKELRWKNLTQSSGGKTPAAKAGVAKDLDSKVSVLRQVAKATSAKAQEIRQNKLSNTNIVYNSQLVNDRFSSLRNTNRQQPIVASPKTPKMQSRVFWISQELFKIEGIIKNNIGHSTELATKKNHLGFFLAHKPIPLFYKTNKQGLKSPVYSKLNGFVSLQFSKKLNKVHPDRVSTVTNRNSKKIRTLQDKQNHIKATLEFTKKRIHFGLKKDLDLFARNKNSLEFELMSFNRHLVQNHLVSKNQSTLKPFHQSVEFLEQQLPWQILAGKAASGLKFKISKSDCNRLALVPTTEKKVDLSFSTHSTVNNGFKNPKAFMKISSTDINSLPIINFEQNCDISLTVKKGWIYLQNNSNIKINLDKSIIPLGKVVLDDLLFDHNSVYIECLPNLPLYFNPINTFNFLTLNKSYSFLNFTRNYNSSLGQSTSALVAGLDRTWSYLTNKFDTANLNDLEDFTLTAKETELIKQQLERTLKLTTVDPITFSSLRYVSDFIQNSFSFISRRAIGITKPTFVTYSNKKILNSTESSSTKEKSQNDKQNSQQPPDLKKDITEEKLKQLNKEKYKKFLNKDLVWVKNKKPRFYPNFPSDSYGIQLVTKEECQQNLTKPMVCLIQQLHEYSFLNLNAEKRHLLQSSKKYCYSSSAGTTFLHKRIHSYNLNKIKSTKRVLSKFPNPKLEFISNFKTANVVLCENTLSKNQDSTKNSKAEVHAATSVPETKVAIAEAPLQRSEVLGHLSKDRLPNTTLATEHISQNLTSKENKILLGNKEGKSITVLQTQRNFSALTRNKSTRKMSSNFQFFFCHKKASLVNFDLGFSYPSNFDFSFKVPTFNFNYSNLLTIGDFCFSYSPFMNIVSSYLIQKNLYILDFVKTVRKELSSNGSVSNNTAIFLKNGTNLLENPVFKKLNLNRNNNVSEAINNNLLPYTINKKLEITKSICIYTKQQKQILQSVRGLNKTFNDDNITVTPKKVLHIKLPNVFLINSFFDITPALFSLPCFDFSLSSKHSYFGNRYISKMLLISNTYGYSQNKAASKVQLVANSSLPKGPKSNIFSRVISEHQSTKIRNYSDTYLKSKGITNLFATTPENQIVSTKPFGYSCFLSPVNGEILLKNNKTWFTIFQKNRTMILTKSDLNSFYLPKKTFKESKLNLENYFNLEYKTGTNIIIRSKTKGYKISGIRIVLPKQKNCYKLGKFYFYGDRLSDSVGVPLSGQLIHINNKKITIRKAQPILISPKGILHYYNDDYIKPNVPVATLPYQRLKAGDIVQGIPKVEQYFEARGTKSGRLFRDSLPNLLKVLFKQYKEKLPLDKAVRQSFYKIQKIVVDGIQRVYRSQGVTIADKHLEVVVKQMTSKVQIVSGGQTGYFPGELVDLEFIEHINKFLMKKVQYEPVILGITRASLEVDSFLSSASFQQTTKILSNAAFSKKKDFLKGLKENVIIGNLIPAGTGYLVYLKDLQTRPFISK